MKHKHNNETLSVCLLYLSRIIIIIIIIIILTWPKLC